MLGTIGTELGWEIWEMEFKYKTFKYNSLQWRDVKYHIFLIFVLIIC